MVLCQRCYLRSRITKSACIGTSQIAGTFSATIVIPFQYPRANSFYFGRKERLAAVLWELWETNCCMLSNGTVFVVQIGLSVRSSFGFSIVSTGVYVICSVMMPQTKHANSRATATFATFLGE